MAIVHFSYCFFFLTQFVSMAETLIQTANVTFSPPSLSQILEICKVSLSISLPVFQVPLEASRHCCFVKCRTPRPRECEDQPFRIQHHLVNYLRCPQGLEADVTSSTHSGTTHLSQEASVYYPSGIHRRKLFG